MPCTSCRPWLSSTTVSGISSTYSFLTASAPRSSKAITSADLICFSHQRSRSSYRRHIHRTVADHRIHHRFVISALCLSWQAAPVSSSVRRVCIHPVACASGLPILWDAPVLQASAPRSIPLSFLSQKVALRRVRAFPRCACEQHLGLCTSVPVT